MSLSLKAARIEDADLLLVWRNDPQTQEASHSNGNIELHQHHQWLEKLLSDPKRQLYIAREKQSPVGCIRAEQETDGTWRLSWTVAPNARGKGMAKQMLCLFVGSIQAPLRAEIKAANLASIKVAEYAGMRCYHKQAGVCYFKRD